MASRAYHSPRSGAPLAVVGAGMAGLAAACQLAAAGWRVSLFDKGRRPGGRLASRRFGRPGAQVEVDMGAAYATAHLPEFRALLDAAGAAPWPPRAGALVGVPTMASLVEAMGKGLGVVHGVEVEGLRREVDGWRLEGVAQGPFERVVLAVPAPQAARLAQRARPALAERARKSAMAPCWVVLAGFAEPTGKLYALIEDEGPLAHAHAHASRPGRALPPGLAEIWALHASADWSRAHLEQPPADVAARLVALFSDRPADLAHAHRWRFARVTAPAGSPFLEEDGLAMVGDWLLGGRIEAAFISGQALGRHWAGA